MKAQKVVLSAVGGTPKVVSPGRRKSPEAVLASRRKILLDRALTSMIEAIPDFVMILSEERQILAVNSRLLQVFGIARIEALVGRRPGEALGCLFSSEGSDGCGSGQHCTTCGAAASIVESQQSKTQTVRECRLSLDREEGGSLDLLVVSTPTVIDAIPLTVCVLKDISAEKWRDILERVFFHDVINTAGGIRGLASLLAQGKLGDEADEAHYKQWLVELSERLIDEITHQRNLVTAEKGEFVPDLGLVELPSLFGEVHALYANHEVADGVDLVLGMIPHSTFVSDGAILRRVLGNLVKNALEATPSGGTVAMSAVAAATSVTMSVHNPGVIPEDVQLQLFQRSFSTKAASGRGIGTYGVKLFVERYLRGKVSFSSSEEDGTVFSFTIPTTLSGM